MNYEKKGIDLHWKKKLLFAGVFIQENLLHSVFDRYNDIPSKQWLLMVVCKSFDTPPDLSTLGQAMGCSRQNVKKLALQLEKKGFIQFEKSKQDARSLCVRVTEKGNAFNKKNEELGRAVHNAIFKEFSDKEIEQYYELSIKMMHGIGHLEEYFRNEEEGKE